MSRAPALDPAVAPLAGPDLVGRPAAGLRHRAVRTWPALGVPDYRRFFAGQLVSVAGTWMQAVAQAWLVLQLTDSGLWLGAVTAAQALPVLVVGAWAGVVADRVDKRVLLIRLQVVAGLLALLLGLATLTGVVELWMVLVLAVGLGLVNAFDVPARQALVPELVGDDLVARALGLNSVIVHGARLVGPLLAAAVIATAGLAACFLLNAASYLAAVIALSGMAHRHRGVAPAADDPGAGLRSGLRAVAGEPALLVPLLVMAVVGTLTYEFQVTLPLVARFVHGTGPEGYSLLLSAMSVGAVLGGAVAASRNRASHRGVARRAVVLGVLVLAVAAAPSLWLTVVLLPFVGAASVAFLTGANATLQASAPPGLRGRVMALYAVAFLGTTPVGGPLVGALAAVAGPRAALAVGGAAAVLAGAVAWPALRRAGEASGTDRAAAPAVPRPAPPTPVPSGAHGEPRRAPTRDREAVHRPRSHRGGRRPRGDRRRRVGAPGLAAVPVRGAGALGSRGRALRHRSPAADPGR